jgi:two-component system chemotaxis response regulator CheB
VNRLPVRQVAAVAIGASAGGVAAVGQLLEGLPERCPFAVIVLVHLPENSPSLLPAVLAARCALPVREVFDKEPVAPGCVWVAPPGYHLYVQGDRTFALSLDAPVHYCRPSIDVLLESAADAYGPDLVGLVLTGANQDGAAGLAAVERAGGVVAVQDPSSALAAAMPAAARAATHAPGLTLGALREYLRALALA